MIMSQGQILGLAQEVGLSGQSARIAAAIAMAESKGDTSVVNPGTSRVPEHSVGLWQINMDSHPGYSENQLKDPLQNALAMYSISNGGTYWRPWSTYTNGEYLQYLANTVNPVTYTGVGSIGIPATGPVGNTTRLTSYVSTNKAVFTDTGSGWPYILAYTVAILIFVFIARFEAGYNALWYLSVLTLMLLVLTQYRFIKKALRPITAGPRPTPATASL